MDTIKDIAHTLANLAEPIEYLDEVENCKDRPGECCFLGIHHHLCFYYHEGCISPAYSA